MHYSPEEEEEGELQGTMRTERNKILVMLILIVSLLEYMHVSTRVYMCVSQRCHYQT